MGTPARPDFQDFKGKRMGRSAPPTRRTTKALTMRTSISILATATVLALGTQAFAAGEVFAPMKVEEAKSQVLAWAASQPNVPSQWARPDTGVGVDAEGRPASVLRSPATSGGYRSLTTRREGARAVRRSAGPGSD